MGLVAGGAIVVLEVGARHARLDMPRATLTLSDTPLVVPFVLVPLALFWGWTWAADRWAGRSLPRLALFTIGLYGALALPTPLDALVSHGYDVSATTVALEGSGATVLRELGTFALPAAIAAPLYWLFGSGRLPTNRLTLGIAYVIGPSLALISPIATMGAVAGTAAGHAWHSPNARSAIAVLVAVLLVLVAVGLPYLFAQLGIAAPPARSLLLP